MKKNLNTFLVALLTVGAGINFTACSSDNDDVNNVINNETKTLTDEQADKAVEKALKQLEAIGAVLRA